MSSQAVDMAVPGQDPPISREQLCQIIQQWNANRVDLFAMTMPDQNDLEFTGIMRYFFQDEGQKVATKCIRVSSTATTKDVINTLIEKFRPDIRMLSIPEYAIYEIHENGEERKLADHEHPLLVQLEWHRDDREGRFLLRRMDDKIKPDFYRQYQPETSFKRKLSKREKKEKKKLEKQKKLSGHNNNNGKEGVAEKLYAEMPESRFTRSISNPEAVLRRRRQQLLERKLEDLVKAGGINAGGTLRIFGESLSKSVAYKTLLLSTENTAAYVVREILQKYDKPVEEAPNYCLVQLIVPHNITDINAAHALNGDSGIREYILDDDDCPLAIEKNHNMSKGVLSFHIKRRPADYMPRKRKKPSHLTPSLASEDTSTTTDPRLEQLQVAAGGEAMGAAGGAGSETSSNHMQPSPATLVASAHHPPPTHQVPPQASQNHPDLMPRQAANDQADDGRPAGPEVIIIMLQKSANGLGLSIIATKPLSKQRGSPNQDRTGIYIKTVVKGGAAEQDGRLEAGDQLLSVDGQSLIGISQEEAARILTQTGPVVRLEVAKQAASYVGLGDLLRREPNPQLLRTNTAPPGDHAETIRQFQQQQQALLARKAQLEHQQQLLREQQQHGYNRNSSSSTTSIPKSIPEMNNSHPGWPGPAPGPAGPQSRVSFPAAQHTYPGPGMSHQQMLAQQPPYANQPQSYGPPQSRPLSMVSQTMIPPPGQSSLPLAHEERHYQNVAQVMAYQNGAGPASAYGNGPPPLQRPLSSAQMPPPMRPMSHHSYSQPAVGQTPMGGHDRDQAENDRMTLVHQVLNRAMQKHEQSQVPMPPPMALMRQPGQPQPGQPQPAGRRMPNGAAGGPGYYPQMNGHAYPSTLPARIGPGGAPVGVLPPHARGHHMSYSALHAEDQRERMSRMQEEFRRREAAASAGDQLVNGHGHMTSTMNGPRPVQRPNAEEWAKRSQHNYQNQSTVIGSQIEEQEERLRRLQLEQSRRQQELVVAHHVEEQLLQAAKNRQENDIRTGPRYGAQRSLDLLPNSSGNAADSDLPPPLPNTTPPPLDAAGNPRLTNGALDTHPPAADSHNHIRSYPSAMRNGGGGEPNSSAAAPVQKKSVSFSVDVAMAEAIGDHPESGSEPESPRPLTNGGNSSLTLQDIDIALATAEPEQEFAATNTPNVIGAQEVYRDPRARILQDKARHQPARAQIQGPEKLSFKEKMQMFAMESKGTVIENGKPKRPGEKSQTQLTKPDSNSREIEGEEATASNS